MLTKLDDIISKFIKARISAPRLEAMMLIENAKDETELDYFVEQRLASKPICKIIGKKEFYKFSFSVDENVLSPRPDTETLVEAAIEIIKKDKIKNILELGVGSGCIILSLLKEFNYLNGVGIDISKKALEVAKTNASDLDINDRINFINASWFDEDLFDKLNKKFDIIVSNPPYIPSDDILSLDKDVKDYDPIIALDGGEDGLRDYKQISLISQKLLNDNGYIFLEVGIYQSNDVIKIFKNQKFKLVDVIKDLSGVERCIILKK